MRNQYFGDSRDVFKWSVILRLVRAHSIRTVLHVAMLRPDDGSGEGGTTHLPSVVEYPVRQFFEAERRAFERNSNLRDIRRIAELPTACGGGFGISVFDRTFNRVGYFDEVLDTIGALPSPALVFLDPDTGMGQGKGVQRFKQIRVDEVGAVFAALRTGDVLALFQYKWRRAGWVRYLKEMFRGAVGGAAAEHVADRDPALFSAVRGLP